MTSYITLPGIGGSGEEHWQTRWERADSRFKRFQPPDWDKPDIEDWVAALERSTQAANGAPVIVAHSLACLLVAHWAHRSSMRIAGAFLVSVPDPAGPKFPAEAASFANVPTIALPFPTLIVASENDAYGTIEFSRRRADEWRASLIVAGALGHINASSNLGDWPQGRALLEAFCAGMSRTVQGQLCH
jgi:predicted alpha/beta hydrolase family esterase